VARLARAGWLAVAPEAASGLRFARGLEDVPVCDGLEQALAAGELPVDGEPDFVLQIGGAPTGRATLAWLAARPRLDRAVIGAHHVPEAVNRASTVIPGDPGLVLAELTARLEADPPDSPADEWPAPLLAASDRAWRRLQSVPGDASGAGSAALSEPAAVRLAVGAVPDGGLLVLSNSLPVRETDLFVRAAPLGVEVLSQRGASGIDGIVAGAAGAADATGRPTVLLVGDVAFLHDLTGLAAARGVGAPLAVVVLANGGGRIFELLPVRGLSGIEPVFRRYFLTPPEVDAVAAAASLGVPGVVASTADELGGALADALTRRGPTVVEARVEPGSAVDAIRALDRSSASTDT
jgi:2-succinyl-5-enolpyruvyl-6-hydroxy-3-cyclohexene-1-carboxylate synthase